MSRQDDINLLYTPPKPNKAIVAYENLFPPCRILQVMSIEDIMNLNAIAKDKSLAAKPVQKFNMIKSIMANRGFKKLASGTNRIVFKYMENQSFVIKVAFDSIGLSDNLNEMYNQEYLKPFCTKVYEVSPCGTVGMFERVIPMRNRKEFELIAPDVFDIIVNHLIGRYILNDFGTKYFMNWGIRPNMHPVILDFPYVYELDGAKIHCNRPDPMSEKGYCGGEIDYDDGFNKIICKKCGKTYLASELKLAAEKKSNNITIETEEINMVISVVRGEEVLQQSDSTNESRTYKLDKKGRRKETPLEYRERKMYEGVSISIIPGVEKTEEQKEETAAPILSEEKSAISENNRYKHEYDANMFNSGYDLSSVPSIDKMYADGKLKVSDNKGNVVLDEKKEEDDRRQILENTFANNPIPSEPEPEEVAPLQAEVEVAEPYYANDEEEDQNTEEENPQEDEERAMKRAQAEAMVNIIPRESVSDENSSITDVY